MDMKEWEKNRILERLEMSGRPKARNMNELKAHLLKWLSHLWEYEMCGDTLYDINRRYGPLCKSLGTSSKELIKALAKEDKVLIEFHERKTLVIGVEYGKLRESIRKEGGTDYNKITEELHMAQKAVIKATLTR